MKFGGMKKKTYLCTQHHKFINHGKGEHQN